MPKRLQEDILVGEVIQEWTIQEYEKHERGWLWYLIMIGLGIFLVIYGMVTGNFLFSLVIILFAIILFLQNHQEPMQIPFQITELGIVLGGKFYSYFELDNFYIIYQPPHVKTLYLKTKTIFHPLLRIPLLDQNPIEIKNSLREFLFEDTEQEGEPASDSVARNWKIH